MSKDDTMRESGSGDSTFDPDSESPDGDVRDRISDVVSSALPAFITERYAAKFVISFLFVVLVIAVIGGVGYVQASSTVEQDARDSLNSTATLQADALDEWIAARETQTQSIADSDALRGTENESKSYIAGFRYQGGDRDTDVLSIHFVDTQSDVVLASTHSSFENESLSAIDEPWADPAVGEEIAYQDHVWNSGTSYASPVLEEEVMAFVADVPGAHGYVVLIATIERRVGTLHQSGLRQSTMILNADGDPVFEGEQQTQSFIGDDQERELIDRALEDEEVKFDQRQGMVLAYAPIPDHNWVAVTSSPTEHAFAVRNDVGQSVLSIIVVSILALGVVGVVLGRQTIPPLTRLRERAEAMEDGDLNVSLETRRRDEIGQLFHAFDSMRNTLREQIREAQTARDEAETARAESERINEHLETKADEYRAVMEHAADGDLTERMDPASDSEAMSQIARAFNDMLAEIETTLEEVQAFATQVATASEEVTGSSEEVRSASQQVTESVQEISDGAERQNDSLQSVSEEMEQLSTTTEEIAASSNEVADLAAESADTGQDGREAAQEAIDGMNSIETESKEAVAEIENLQEEVDQIDELLEFITDVARQTNLLALNANIEAAHSSEGSEGFAVIADQVKQLASDTQEAAEDIEERLERIKDQTDYTAEEVRRTADEIANQTNSVRQAADALEEVAGYAQETNTGIQEISSATQQQAATAQEVVQMADEAATISEETTAEAETVAAAAEQQTAALTEVSESASNLATQASQLSEALDQFETSADTGASAEAGGRDRSTADDGTDRSATDDGIDGSPTDEVPETTLSGDGPSITAEDVTERLESGSISLGGSDEDDGGDTGEGGVNDENA